MVRLCSLFKIQTIHDFKTLGETYKPKAIVIFTAHWESEVLTISSSDNEYETIYDFGGFPLSYTKSNIVRKALLALHLC